MHASAEVRLVNSVDLRTTDRRSNTTSPMTVLSSEEYHCRCESMKQGHSVFSSARQVGIETVIHKKECKAPALTDIGILQVRQKH